MIQKYGNIKVKNLYYSYNLLILIKKMFNININKQNYREGTNN